MEYIFIYILLVHWLADFVFQTGWMAQNKSKDSWALASHILTYTLVFTIALIPLTFYLAGNPSLAISFAFINGALHWIIDSVTSRISSSLYKQGDVYNFFVVIGFDQFLHVALLYATYLTILKG